MKFKSLSLGFGYACVEVNNLEASLEEFFIIKKPEQSDLEREKASKKTEKMMSFANKIEK